MNKKLIYTYKSININYCNNYFLYIYLLILKRSLNEKINYKGVCL